jgi:hypothetical protein
MKSINFTSQIQSENRAVHDLDYWTSGSQKDCPGRLSWCSLERPMRSRNLSWSNNPDGDCVTVQYRANGSSLFTKTNCDKELPFICEVKYFSVLISIDAINSLCRCTIKEPLRRLCRPSAWMFGMSRSVPISNVIFTQ